MLPQLSDESRVDRILEHLLRDLSTDARTLWSASERPRPRSSDIHSWLHREIGSVGRQLRATRSAVPLHASAITESSGRGVLAVGQTGSGKSTLALLMGSRAGAGIVSDDTIWLNQGAVVGMGAPLAVRPGSPFHDDASALWYASGVDRLMVHPADLGSSVVHSCSVDSIVFPTFGRLDRAFRIVPPVEAFARLLSSVLRPIRSADVTAIAAVAARCPAGLIEYSDSAACVELVQQACLLPEHISAFSVVDRAEMVDSGFGESTWAVRFDSDVAVWNAATNSVVCVQHWAEGDRLPRGEAFDQLRSLGFVTADGKEGND